MADTGVRVVLVTAPDEATAAALARTLVEERLVACASLVPSVRSVYRWEGRVQDDRESLLVLKTTASALPGLESRLRSLHPYEVPEIIALPVAAGSERYLAWVCSEVLPGGGPGG